MLICKINALNFLFVFITLITAETFVLLNKQNNNKTQKTSLSSDKHKFYMILNYYGKYKNKLKLHCIYVYSDNYLKCLPILRMFQSSK